MIQVEPLTAAAYARFGWVLGERPTAAGAAGATEGESAGFWHEHDFLAGEGGQVELVWVSYKPRPAIVTLLESHRLTEQAIVPVTGQPILQFVAPPPADLLADDIAPDLSAARAFYLDGTKGVCMRAGTWHMQFGLGDNQHLMVTRRSTTDDLRAGFLGGSAMQETKIVEIEPIVLDASGLGVPPVTA